MDQQNVLMYYKNGTAKFLKKIYIKEKFDLEDDPRYIDLLGMFLSSSVMIDLKSNYIPYPHY